VHREISYTGHDLLATDIANLTAALRGREVTEAFLPSASPGGFGRNEHYRAHADYLSAVAEAMRVEYQGILDAGLLLQIDAGAYSFEVANPRHQHEWRIWRDIPLAEDKVLIPGFLGHATNYVEHPELIADGIVSYANLVGRERVIAGADCGFSSRATYAPEVHPTVVWQKFRALAEGAALASKRLWAERAGDPRAEVVVLTNHLRLAAGYAEVRAALDLPVTGGLPSPS
jgi:hypothetical protein